MNLADDRRFGKREDGKFKKRRKKAEKRDINRAINSW